MPDAAKTILLTGGAGFIGSHLAESLLRERAKLAIVDNLDPVYSPEWKRLNLADVRATGDFTFHEIDICELPRLRDVFSSVHPQIVIHLAARAGVRPSAENPLAYDATNVHGTRNVLELCREFHVERFIFGSSSSVYGASSKTPFTEDQLDLHPISVYAATKLSAELLCESFARHFSLPAVSLRLFTVYGPRQRPDLAIHKFTALIEAGKPVPIFGDGSTGRDYTWIEDIVAGILAAISSPLPAAGIPYTVYNLGNSHPVVLTDLVSLLESLIGRRAERQILPLQPGDVPLTWADISKAQRELRYRPATSLSEGLEQFVAWYRASSNRCA